MPLYLIRFGAVTVAVWMVLLTFQTTTSAQSTPKWGGIRVVDEVTGRGVPLVELESTHSVRWISDNTGCIYIDDADLLDQNVFFLMTNVYNLFQ